MPRSRPVAVLVAAVLALGALAGARDAAAAAGPSEGAATDACRQIPGLPDAACDTVRAATWGLAAGCRYAGAPDVACGAGDGRAVGEARVAAYEDGWVARAHADQRALQAAVPFGDAFVVATHNSANSTAYAPTPSRYDANQTYAIRDQLRLGVRRLELDVHWWYDTATGERAPVLCHATGAPHAATGVDTPPTRHAGCSAEFPLATGLRELRSWLDAHPGEVVMVRFETHLESVEAYAAATAQLEEELGDLLWQRAGDAGGCPDLPLDATVAEMRAAGRQVIAVGDCGPAGSAWGALTYRYAHVEATYRGTFDGYPACGPHFADDAYASTWVRYFEDATWVSSVTAAGGGGPAPLDGSTARDMARCGVNEVSFDHLTPDDGRLEALVWTWAPGEDDDVGEDCAALDADGRFASRACTDVRPFACRDADGRFVTTAEEAAWLGAGAACGAVGAAPAVPRTPVEATELAAVAGGVEAWLDYARHADGWRSADR